MPSFEVERFERAGPDRLEVAGRWYDVRGRRFVRPTLEVAGARPLLALLEHKPWAPVEGEEWVAAFPWDGEPAELEHAELAVAPDIVVALGGSEAPPAPAPRRDDPGKLRRERDAGRAPVEVDWVFRGLAAAAVLLALLLVLSVALAVF